MNKIHLFRIFHRDVLRLAIRFPYDNALTNIVREVPNAKFSNTQKCWYCDDTEDNLRMILKLFRDTAEVDISAISSSVPAINNKGMKDEPNPEQEMPVTISKVEIEPDEGTDDEDSSLIDPDEGRSRRFDAVEFRIAEDNTKLIIRFTGRYDKAWIDEMKSYGKLYFDKYRREFMLPWSKVTVDSLADYFAGIGVPVNVIRPAASEVTKELRKNFGDEVRSRELTAVGKDGIDDLRKYMEDCRYSLRTIETYTVLLELFFKYFNMKDPGKITQNEVTDFMNDFIIKNGFSASYQNQMVSAIKMYYEISGKGKVIPQLLERPRRGRALPKVFSKEEVTTILNSAGNTKHKLLLWMIYSCGLRRSEVTKIRLNDIDRTRNIIHIREGKGGIDRIVPVPDKLWLKMDEYIESYHPADYLFEGQSGRRYSAVSVYSVFRQALKKAGINKEVGVHCLRHSYATHLHEKGLDIRYIQELLGHKNSRTTEIYTHVSRRNLVAVKSPLEDLDVK